jgi:hypothetical protein
MGWLEVADDALSDRFSSQYVEYYRPTKVTVYFSFFKVLAGITQL